MTGKLFLSHAHADKQDAQALRRALEDSGVAVWEDVLELRAGDRLAELEREVKQSRGLLLLWTAAAGESKWVEREAGWALEARAADSGYRILIVLRGGSEASVKRLLGEELVFLPATGSVEDAVPEIRRALGERAPSGRAAEAPEPPPLLEELVISFADARIEESGGRKRAAGRFRVHHRPAQGAGSRSPWRDFESPLGPLELGEIRWYLERYPGWPFGPFRDRARDLEAQLPRWGRALHELTLGLAPEQTGAWKRARGSDRRVVIEVDDPGSGSDAAQAGGLGIRADGSEAQPSGSGPRGSVVQAGSELRPGGSEVRADHPEAQAGGSGAQPSGPEAPAHTGLAGGAHPPSEGAGAAALLALPWELLADDKGYLFEGGLEARVVRRIPREESREPLPAAERLRVLLVIARPEQEGVSFLDPRASARPLIEALAPLGHRAELEVLADGTFPALEQALARADDAGRPFHVVHFDGHGVYDPSLGLGMLCFEEPADAEENKLKRRAKNIDSERLGALLRDRRVPLFVLEACQTAMADEKVTASVAARLLRAGVGSVLAMTHAVLVETARRFVSRFYEELARGERIGSAMVAAQRYLQGDAYRGEVGGHGELHLQDWYVPVLFQEEEGDVQLLPAGFHLDAEDLAAQRLVREGELPETPAHGFVGRARELLAVQRLLRDECRLALLGDGGQGKTALAVECARWLLDLRRVDRVAFASVEDLPGARLLLERLGRQLVSGYSVATEEGTGTDAEKLRRARLPVERVLAERRVLLVVDNLESVLPAPGREAPAGLGEMLDLLDGLSEVGETRLLLTSREAPPAPLDGIAVRLGPLSAGEGRELVAGVLARLGREPAGDAEERRVDELVEAVRGHARSLVLLAPLVAERGLEVTAESVARLLAELEERHPGQRELSLLASVRLSLDRLPEKERRQVRALAVFHGAAHYEVLAHVLEVEPDEALALCRQLVALGLADAEGPYLLPDPALGPAVADESSTEERRGMEDHWLGAMLGLIDHLYQMYFQNAKGAAEGTRAALKDLLAALAWAEDRVEAGQLPAEVAMDAMTSLRQLVEALGRPAVLVQLEEVRRRLEQRLGEWSNARFESARAGVEQRLNAGDTSGAVRSAEQLRERAEAAGDAYPGAAYDRAAAGRLLGHTLRVAGRAGEALPLLEESKRRLAELAQAGNESAARMLAVVAGDRGDAFRDLGRLDEAAESQERGIAINEKWGNRRSAAVGRFQLGTVRLLQGRLKEALDAYHQACQTFEELQEPRQVATAWHQIGQVYEVAEQWDRAETAYQQSLRIRVEIVNKRDQASSLDQLGLLYGQTRRLEEAAQLHRQAATLRGELGDGFTQARSLSNMSIALRDLGRLDEARKTATEAAQLATPFGYAAEPWKTWNILKEIETQAGRPDAALAARSRARELYAAYRRDGGEPQFQAGRLIGAIGQALQEQGSEVALRLIPPPRDWPEDALTLRNALLAIIGGSRDPALAQDDSLSYAVAVELSLLLEMLNAPGT